LCRTRPLQLGLAELVAYLELASEEHDNHRFQMVVDETVEDWIEWQTEVEPGQLITRRARLPRIIFLARRTSDATL
jgi:hypothetical protein